MRRETCTPRPSWSDDIANLGLTFNSKVEGAYWDEGACYHFTAQEIDKLEAAGNALHELCLTAAQEIIDRDWWQRLRIDPRAAETIKASWNDDQQHLYGRFDMLWDGTGEPKMLEYNADTPTSLLESAVIQWDWMEKTKGEDQFNSIHERLVARWKLLGIPVRSTVHVTCPREYEEDYITAEYMADTCRQAGFEVVFIDQKDIGSERRSNDFVDLAGKPIKWLFKLTPWEWMLDTEFAPSLRHDHPRIIEPAWKMLWSNKAILPILWELAPNHPNLLRASFETIVGEYVRKPIYSREGANITISAAGADTQTVGEYGDEGFVYQEFKRVEFDGKKPVLGLWIIGDECAGMGIRESDGWVTNNTSHFVPHYFTK